MIDRIQYAVAWTLIKTLGVLPRGIARAMAAIGVRMLLFALPKLKKTAEFNLRLAFPQWTDARRRATLKKMTRNLGWMAAEFSRTHCMDFRCTTWRDHWTISRSTRW